MLLYMAGAFDLLAVAFVVAGHHEYEGKPPTAAIVAVAIIALVTVASAVGLARAQRWSRPAALTGRVLDSISWMLGLVAHPDFLLTAIAAVGLVLSIVTIVLLVRLHPRERHQDQAAQPAPAAAAPRRLQR
jgi:hypothetical protein